MVNLEGRIEKSTEIQCFWHFLYNKRVVNGRFSVNKPTELIIRRVCVYANVRNDVTEQLSTEHTGPIVVSPTILAKRSCRAIMPELISWLSRALFQATPTVPP